MQGRWKQLGLVAGLGALALGFGYGAIAETPAPPSKAVERRVAELEMKVKLLELQLRAVEIALDRTPRLGPQGLQQK